MRAWICPKYGSPQVLDLEEVATPKPDRGEVVVRLRSASVNTADTRIRGCRFPAGMGLAARLALGWSGPRQRILGADCAGVVESVGPGVERWRAGDPVLVVKGAAMGCHAECVLVRATDVMVQKPESLGWAESVSLPFGGQTAKYYLKKSGIKSGDKVLVIGASGAVGSAALQWIAMADARATAVTRRCNSEWVTQLGAEVVLDYTETNYAAGSARFDLVMDCVGAGTFRTLRHLVKPGGAYVAVAGGLEDFLARPSGGVRCVTGVTPESSDVVNEMIALVQAGKFRPMVGETFPFERLPAAHELVDAGHKRGVVVVEFDSQSR